MYKEKLVFIVNPISGKAKKQKKLIKALEKYLDKNSFDYRIVYTRYRKHASKITKDYLQKNYKYFIAVGGDGTVHEVASELVNTEGILGIIPAGSGNGLARHLSIPSKLKESIEIINKRKITKIDVGKINEEYFFCTCGTGFDAEVGKLFDKLSGRGFRSYVKAVIKKFFSYKPKKYKIKVDGNKIKEKAFLITLANASQYGNNAYIAPEAKIDDGYLDVCILKPFPKINSIGIGVRLFSKSIHNSDFVKTIKAKSITIKRNKKGYVHIDGEPVKMKKKLKIEILEKSLYVIINN